MPFIMREIELHCHTTKGIKKTTHPVYVTPAKMKAGDVLMVPTAKQLPGLADKYPKEYDGKLGYIGKEKKADPED